MNEIDYWGIPEPCQPIGCDSGFHLTGCVYAEVDEEITRAVGWNEPADQGIARAGERPEG